jgi:hypothetical protein
MAGCGSKLVFLASQTVRLSTWPHFGPQGLNEPHVEAELGMDWLRA